MSWPALDECYRIVDWSYFDNNGADPNVPKDVNAYINQHPEVDGVIIRFIWPNGVPDPKYPVYYDSWNARNKMVFGYGWANGFKSVSATMQDWKAALGVRIPPILGTDWESTAVMDVMNNAQFRQKMFDHDNAVAQTFPDQARDHYSSGGYLDTRFSQPTEWMMKFNWWLAHWIFPPPDFSDQATSYQEVDQLLPIDNNFTPYRGARSPIPIESVKGWQFSSHIDGKGDASYFLKSWIDSILGAPEPEPEPNPIAALKFHLDQSLAIVAGL